MIQAEESEEYQVQNQAQQTLQFLAELSPILTLYDADLKKGVTKTLNAIIRISCWF